MLKRLFGSPSIEKLKAKRDIPGLIRMLSDCGAEDVCSRAATALGELGDTRAVEPLIRALNPVLAFMRKLSMAAATALGRLGDPRAVQPLVDCLKRTEIDPQMAEVLKLKKQVALRASGFPFDQVEAEAKDWVRKEFREPLWTVRLTAAMALGELRNAQAIEALLLALLDESPVVAMNAADALAKIGDAALDPLIASLADARARVRSGAARALGQIRDARASQALMGAANDEDGEVCQYAAAGLKHGRWRPPMDALVAELGGRLELYVMAGPGQALARRSDWREELRENGAAHASAVRAFLTTKYGLSPEEIQSVSALVLKEIQPEQAAPAERAAQPGGTKQCLLCQRPVELLRHTCPHCGGEAFAQAGTTEDSVAMLDAMQKQARAAEHVDRGARFLLDGMYTEAEAELRQAIAINPLNATAHANMGGLYQRLGRPGEAIPWLEKALELNPQIEGVSQALAEARAAQRAGG